MPALEEKRDLGGIEADADRRFQEGTMASVLEDRLIAKGES